MEHVFSCTIVSDWEFTTNKKNLKTVGLLTGGNKKIVHDPYVFVGPMCLALPIPLLALWSFLALACQAARRPVASACMLQAGADTARSFWVIWVIWVTVLN